MRNVLIFLILNFLNKIVSTEIFEPLTIGKMLMEHETTKLKEQEELYARELREWKAHLKPRKQVN